MRAHRDLESAWKAYTSKFIHNAAKAGHDVDYMRTCLNYAQPIFYNGFPIIYDQEHLSALCGYRIEYIRGATNDAKSFYRQYRVPKKKYGTRLISEPLPSLKEIQRWILDNIISKCEVHSTAKAFVAGRSIKENARFHRRQHSILNIDIVDFFDSVQENYVQKIFQSIGYSNSVSMLLTKLCVLDGSLPQGAPTSPCLSNIVCRNIDKRIFSYAKRNKLRYTRYADDITLSGEINPGPTIQFLRKVLNENNFHIHNSKIKFAGSGKQKRVTGIVVNQKLQVPRAERRRLRQIMYYIQKYGFDSHVRRTNNTKRNHLYYLLGKVNFVLFVNPNDEEAMRWKEILQREKLSYYFED